MLLQKHAPHFYHNEEQEVCNEPEGSGVGEIMVNDKAEEQYDVDMQE